MSNTGRKWWHLPFSLRAYFERGLKPEGGDYTGLLYYFFGAALLFVLVVAIAFMSLLIAGIPPEKLGVSGDFFGGFVNPILTFFTFVGVLLTIYLSNEATKIQAADAKDQRIEARRQTFEAAFFQMLNLHNEIVHSLETIEFQDEPPIKGRGCFRVYYAYLKARFGDQSYAFHGPDPLPAVENAFRTFWNSHRQDLGHYYRYLFNIIRFVDESHMPVSEHQQHEAKMRYMKLLRAQLSDYELLLLFYNSVSGTGRRFIQYLNRYELLDNMPRDLIISSTHLGDFPEIYMNPEPLDK